MNRKPTRAWLAWRRCLWNRPSEDWPIDRDARYTTILATTRASTARVRGSNGLSTKGRPVLSPTIFCRRQGRFVAERCSPSVRATWTAGHWHLLLCTCALDTRCLNKRILSLCSRLYDPYITCTSTNIVAVNHLELNSPVL